MVRGGKLIPRPKEQREQAHAMYVSGIPLTKVSKQLGIPYNTLCKWSKLGQWFKGKSCIEAVAGNAIASTIARSLETASASVQLKASDKLEEQAEALHKLKTNGLKDLILQQPLVKGLVDTADKLYGWSRSDAPRCLVQVGVMAQFAPKAETEQASDSTQAKPIDAQVIT